ncbi:hypothetical protein ACFXTH_040983 [Malus domestica]
MDEQCHDCANRVGPLELRGNCMDSEETFSDQNLDPNLQFQHQDPRFRHQDYQFQCRQPPIKLDLPRFVEGDDPLAWVYKAEHFFDYFSVVDNRKVQLASFHFDREGLERFQWRNCLKNFPRWPDFVKIFCREFSPSEFEDFSKALIQLRQTGLVRDYIAEFRCLANRTHEIAPSMLKSCFIRGLKPELRHDVKLLWPLDNL